MTRTTWTRNAAVLIKTLTAGACGLGLAAPAPPPPTEGAALTGSSFAVFYTRTSTAVFRRTCYTSMLDDSFCSP
jgi:hypothetical protein